MLDQKQRDCLLACNDCAAACHACVASCLAEAEPKPMVRCITLDMECADLCRLVATSLARGDEHSAELCLLCARVCQACGSECARHPMDHCQQCAEACMRCATACRVMAS